MENEDNTPHNQNITDLMAINNNNSNNNNCSGQMNNHSVGANSSFKMKSGSNVSMSFSSKMKLHEFFINDRHRNKNAFKHRSNYISTTKYNVITFLPKSFLIQFARLPNIYFLVTAVIQSIPLISPLTSVTAIIPLIFVLSVSMIRELIEDISRHSYDKMNNEEKVTVYREGGFKEAKSQDLTVGEFVIVSDNSPIPCDMVLMDSNLNEGVCYVETSSLDGEKALKQKISNRLTNGLFRAMCHDAKSIYDIGNIDIVGYCQCDHPNPDLNKLDGKIQLTINGIKNEYPISSNQMLLKGAIVKHTGWAIGFVIYTGLNNKIILNSKRPRMKISKIEKKMNKFLIGVFIFQMILCAICAYTHNSNYNNHKVFYANYIKLDRKPGVESFITFFTYLLLLNTLIPISLIVTLEIVKIAQGFFIKWDVDLYSKEKKKFCKASSVSLNEELGNVNYIFSDKTGTLTCNKMQFKYCAIGETCYEYKKKTFEPPKNQNVRMENGSNLVDNSQNLLNNYTNNNPTLPELNAHKEAGIGMLNERNQKMKIIQIGPHYFENIINKKGTGKSSLSKAKSRMNDELNVIHEFWISLACAHECVCSETENGLEYSGVSPDDVELVKTASAQGYSFLKSPSNIRRIMIGNKEHQYEILNILNFSSERKRMSIILKEGDVIKVFTKGADCEIKKRLSKDSPSNYFQAISKCVDVFSAKGYRTLMVAEKVISQQEYNEWSEKLRNGEMNLAKKHTLIESCYNEMEQNLILLGATMVEDKLQDNVPETIRDLRLAGIKIWVLTGDKIDTAENIALSCNLISKTHRNFKIQSKRGENTIRKDNYNIDLELQQFINEFREYAFTEEENLFNINNSCSGKSDDNLMHSQSFNITPFSILIEAPVLAGIFRYEETTKQFLKIALYASTVICCRVSPLQKSQVVKVVKHYQKDAITLAIGDGGNDVSMIMEAHIGIGIYGEEGMRAVQASDFSIGEFHLLRRLLFFHGRTNSNRISQMILYFFYKNFVFTITHFFFCFCCLASGQTIIDDWFITFYNLVFTALPLGVQACSDFDIKEEDGHLVKEMMPFLYKESRDDPQFCFKAFFTSLFKGLLLGLFNYIILLFSISETGINDKGFQESLWFSSLILYTNIILSVSFTLLLTERFIIFLVPLVLGVTSWGLYFGFCFYVHYSNLFNSSGSILESFQSGKFYLLLIVVSGFSFVIDYALESSHFAFGSSMSTHLMKLNNKHLLDSENSHLPDIIIQARKNIELITKYNNYNVLQNQSESPSVILSQGFDNAFMRLSKKSKSQKNFGGTWFGISVNEKPDKTERKAESQFHSDYGLNGSRGFSRKWESQRISRGSQFEKNDEESNTINANEQKVKLAIQAGTGTGYNEYI